MSYFLHKNASAIFIEKNEYILVLLNRTRYFDITIIKHSLYHP